MGARAEALAKQFELAARSVTETLGRLTDADWRKTTSGEKWTVGVVAHHIAMGHAGIANMIKSIASGQSVPNLTQAKLDEMNAAHARDQASCVMAESLEL